MSEVIATLSDAQRIMSSLLLDSAKSGVLRKCVFSKSVNSEEIRTELSVILLGDRQVIREIAYMRDGKAIQKNLDYDDSSIILLFDSHGQINLLTTVGECEYRRSRSGKEITVGDKKLRVHLSGEIDDDKKVAPENHNRKKNRLLDGTETFLAELGIADANGRIHDKKQHKFRQICRFLEYVEDVYRELPSDGTLIVYDLCCGKSYLSFALYHYFVFIKQRKIKMTGVDLKADVIDYCSEVSKKLGYNGLKFVCGDINEFAPETEPHLVVSLHACDVATDIVLRYATDHRAWVILSTPCCQRELSAAIDCPELEFATKYPILRRKLCDALTDSLRLSFLASRGYTVEACELVDPDDTPKNILLRAVKQKNFDPDSRSAEILRKEFEQTASFLLGGDVERTLTILK